MKRKVRSKKVTIDSLAVMIQRGFNDTPTKGDFENLDGSITVLKKDVADLRQEMHHRFDTLSRRIDTMATHERRIERLERIVDKLVKI